jgi:allantoicase
MSEFQELPNLASGRLGARVVAANDEFFAPKENLLKDSKPVFIEDKYTDRGKWMDGWETRRRRIPGHDWCIVRLGLPGIIRGVIVDTSYFRGNYPEQCSLEACAISPATGLKRELDALHAPSTKWYELIAQSDLKGDSQNGFEIRGDHRFTHVRLKIFPDGGVARLRIHGEGVPTPARTAESPREVDLAAIQNGGRVLAASDEFFSAPLNLLMPGRSTGMHDGWETRRRRGTGHDWVIIKLGASATIRRIEVDTAFFKGNYPDSCSLDAVALANGVDPDATTPWRALLPQTKLRANAPHLFKKEIVETDAVSHIRFNIYPDGGVSRLRIWGAPVAGSQGTGLDLFNSLPEKKAAAALLDCCGAQDWVRRMLASRPFLSADELTQAADEFWNSLSRKEWLQAFRHHPRIGGKKAQRKQSAKAGQWSAKEQSGVAQATGDARAGLAAANRTYEAKFGHIFIICAAGKSAEEIQQELQRRLGNDRETELRIAAEEQRKITRLRLEKLLAS